MSVADCLDTVLRAPGQDNFRNGRRARFAYTGFTLIELLVVMSVIAALAAILVPVFSSAISDAQRTACASNLRQIVLAWQMYANDNSYRACPSYYYTNNGRMYAWDFTQAPGGVYKDGLLSRYARCRELNKCPSFTGIDSDNRPYTGYAYNASYIGGDPANEPPLPTLPCFLSEIAHPQRTAVFADGGYGNPVMSQNFLRAPSSRPIKYIWGTVDFRHNGFANVAYADTHVAATNVKYRYNPGYAPECGTLSQDDSAYALQ